MKLDAVFLQERKVIKVGGDDAKSFLHGIITNDIEKSTNGLYSGLLSPQGKILFDFFIFNDGPQFLIELPSSAAEDFTKRLTFYKLRADVQIDTSNDLKVLISSEKPGPGITEEISFPDPRFNGMGWRVYLPEQKIPQINADENLNVVPEESYHQLRVQHCIPEMGHDYQSGKIFPHDACFDLLNGVDFNKGCYIGQEVVSRMLHRGTSRKRFLKVIGQEVLPDDNPDILVGEQAIGTLGTVHEKMVLRYCV